MTSQDVIYLDYNATTPLADEVNASILSALHEAWGNPSSKYDSGVKAKALVDEARTDVASCIHTSASNIIFTSGGTESNNWVIHSVLEYYKSIQTTGHGIQCIKPHIVTSIVEHDSIIGPLAYLEKCGLADVTRITIDKVTGDISASSVASAIQRNTILVTVMMANNETGAIMPIREITASVREMEEKLSSKIFVHTDAAQTVGKIPVDVIELDVDFLTIVGHKFYGPRIGALYIKNLMENPELYRPLLHGGGQERGWRAGTENTPMIAGLGTAAKMVLSHSAGIISMQDTRDYLRDKLLHAFGEGRIHFNCRASNQLPNTLNVSLLGKGLEGYKVLEKVQSFCCSTGSACHSNKCQPSKVLLNFHIEPHIAANAIRFSTGRQTTRRDIDKVVEELKRVVANLQ